MAEPKEIKLVDIIRKAIQCNNLNYTLNGDSEGIDACSPLYALKALGLDGTPDEYNWEGVEEYVECGDFDSDVKEAIICEVMDTMGSWGYPDEGDDEQYEIIIQKCKFCDCIKDYIALNDLKDFIKEVIWTTVTDYNLENN